VAEEDAEVIETGAEAQNVRKSLPATARVPLANSKCRALILKEAKQN